MKYIMKYRKNINKKLLAVSFILLGAGLFAAELKIIPNPEPNMTENRYIELVEIGTIGEELGNDQYLFSPFSITADKQKNLYIYDNLQAKIFKLDKDFKLITSFGKKGNGAGEFKGNSRIPVYLKMGADGYLYANDLIGFNVISFTTDGKYVNEYRYGEKRKVKQPIVDVKGNIHIFTINADDIIRFNNQQEKPLLTICTGAEAFSFLLAKPAYLENIKAADYRFNLISAMLELPLYVNTVSGKLLVYFPNSSALYVADQGRITYQTYLWPKDALENYKKLLPQEMRKSNKIIKTMFFELFPDNEEDAFYLQLGHNEEKNINALYRFDVKGKLSKVLYVKDNYPLEFTRFIFKYNDLYLAIKDEKIKKYKEKQK
ncbi:MAG TPA: hypothetical protein VK469_12975 [Candidatus Kapabacteria bacterium]|nr:hypothetical protein [Candidatus Kapabacteria bacterium]